MAVGDLCTIADVKGWLPGEQKIDDQTGNPTAGVVSVWITNYSTAIGPLSDPKALARVAILLPRELAYQVMAKRNAAKGEDQEEFYIDWHKEFMESPEGKILFASGAKNLAWSYTQESTYGTVSADPSIDPKISVNEKY